MTEAGTLHCVRCAHEVVPVTVWPGWKWCKRAFYTGAFLLITLAPILMSEITILMPMAMTFALAAGPVHLLAAQKPTCSDCGAELK